MALIKLGSNISEVSGSVNGHTFQKSQGGVQMRNKPINKRQPSQSQSFIRSIHLTLLYAWSNLSAAEQKIWNDFAGLKLFPGKFGDKVKLSGQALFLKYQFVYAYNHLPLITDPFNYNPEPLGPELITNGSFNGVAPWVFTPGWSYNLGFARFLDNVQDYVRAPLTIISGISYLLSFTVFDTPSFLRLSLRDNSALMIFEAPYNVALSLGNFSYSLPVKANNNSSFLRIYGIVTGGQGSITNISFREILS